MDFKTSIHMIINHINRVMSLVISIITINHISNINYAVIRVNYRHFIMYIKRSNLTLKVSYSQSLQNNLD
jgi:hypothetical protein